MLCSPFRHHGFVTSASVDTIQSAGQYTCHHFLVRSIIVNVQFTMFCVNQEEGLSLVKRNGELEAAVRRLRASARESEAEHQQVLSQVKQLEAQLAKEQSRYAQASHAAGEQVLLLRRVVLHSHAVMCLKTKVLPQHSDMAMQESLPCSRDVLSLMSLHMSADHPRNRLLYLDACLHKS